MTTDTLPNMDRLRAAVEGYGDMLDDDGVYSTVIAALEFDVPALIAENARVAFEADRLRKALDKAVEGLRGVQVIALDNGAQNVAEAASDWLDDLVLLGLWPNVA